MSLPFYDRQGQPIDLWTFGALFEDLSYRLIARTQVCEGVDVSTIWLGIDHNWFDEGPPLIFETMVFVSVEPFQSFGVTIDREGMETYRWPTEEAALAGHEQVVAELRGQIREPMEEEQP